MAMDLDYRGHPALSDLFIGLYGAAMGDRELGLLMDACKAYRAVVRGKVDSFLLDHDEVPRAQKAAARRRAKRYFRLAESYTRRPRLDAAAVLVIGPSGSGKSVLAGSLASRLDAVLLSTDMLRRPNAQTGRRADAQSDERAQGESLDEGRYSAGARQRVYEELAGLLSEYLDAGRRVVVDGTFIERAQRALVLDAVAASNKRLLLVQCEAPDAVVEQRQQQRRSEAWSTSEGRYDVYLAQKDRLEPPDEVPATQRLVVDTTRALPEQIEVIMARLVRPRRKTASRARHPSKT
jgi:predicted kinase